MWPLIIMAIANVAISALQKMPAFSSGTMEGTMDASGRVINAGSGTVVNSVSKTTGGGGGFMDGFMGGQGIQQVPATQSSGFAKGLFDKSGTVINAGSGRVTNTLTKSEGMQQINPTLLLAVGAGIYLLHSK